MKWPTSGSATWSPCSGGTTFGSTRASPPGWPPRPLPNIHPDWGFPEDAARDLQRTLDLDAQRTTHPIRATAETPAEINEMFDGISYGKGGAVLGMVEHFVTPEVFREGVHNYLQAHLYSNATAEDFWNAQTSASHLPVDVIMSSFIADPGVPLLTLGPAASGHLPVTQSRFFLAGQPIESSRKAAQTSTQTWTIPVCAAASPCQLLKPGQTTIAAPAAPVLFANAASKGYYRTAYNPDQLQALIPQAEQALSAPERISLAGDQWALTVAGQGSVSTYLDLALNYRNDPDPAVLASVAEVLRRIRDHIAGSPDQVKSFNAVLRQQFRPAYDATGKPSPADNYARTALRAELFRLLGESGDPKILAEARRVAEGVLFNNKREDPALADVSITLAAAHGDANLYDRLLHLSQTETDPVLQHQELDSLGHFTDPTLINRTLDYATSGSVRNQDSGGLMGQMLQQPGTREPAWTWVQAHWDRVQAQLTPFSGQRIVGATNTFCSAERHHQVATFFAAHPVTAAERTLAKSLDSIADCTTLHTREQAPFAAWLAQHP